MKSPDSLMMASESNNRFLVEFSWFALYINEYTWKTKLVGPPFLFTDSVTSVTIKSKGPVTHQNASEDLTGASTWLYPGYLTHPPFRTQL